jgi:hypothetical protein
LTPQVQRKQAKPPGQREAHKAASHCSSVTYWAMKSGMERPDWK